MSQKHVMIYFGHHKCASQYIRRVIKDLCAPLGLKVAKTYFSADKLPHNLHLINPWKEKVHSTIVPDANSGIDFMCYTNASPAIIERLKEISYKGFHVIRDPRDMLISGYFSHKYSHPARRNVNPWIFEHKKRLLGVGFEEGLLLELDHFSCHFERLAAWDFSNPNIYETRFETLTKDPYAEFCRIFDFIDLKPVKNKTSVFINITASVIARKVLKTIFGLPVKHKTYLYSPYILKKILKRRSFEKTTKRKKGDENQKSHYRKGITGDWRNYFTDGLKAEFKKRYGQLLINLQYEKDLNW